MATMTNAAAIEFGTATVDWDTPNTSNPSTALPTHFSVSVYSSAVTDPNHATQNSGNFVSILAAGALTNPPAAIVREQPLRYRAMDFDWSFPAGTLDDRGMVSIVSRYFATTAIGYWTVIRLHYGAPATVNNTEAELRSNELNSSGATNGTSAGYTAAVVDQDGWTVASG